MRKTALIVLFIFISPLCWSFAANEKDTVEIVFGNNSKIIILADSKEDIQKLQNYDLNKMVQDIGLSIEGEEGKEVLVIQDKEGTKYLQDTTIVVEEDDPDFADLQAEFEGKNWQKREEYDSDDDYDYDYNYEYSYEKKEKRTGYGGFIDFGMNNYLMDGKSLDGSQPYYVRPWGSWYVALKANFQTRLAGKFGMKWGPDVSWYNFKYENAAVLMSKGPETVEFDTETLASENPNKSKLTVAYLGFSLVPLFDFGYKSKTSTKKDGTPFTRFFHNDGVRFGFGGYAGYRLDSYSKNVTLQNGNKNKIRDKNKYYINDFRYGLRAIIGYGAIDVFFNYDLNQLYETNRGPKLNGFSFGISL